MDPTTANPQIMAMLQALQGGGTANGLTPMQPPQEPVAPASPLMGGAAAQQTGSLGNGQMQQPNMYGPMMTPPPMTPPPQGIY
jgi:hypothetical protein